MRQRRGFTLMEVLMTLSLIGTATLVAGRLFVASMSTMETNRQVANTQAAADHCDTILRQDIWTAKQIEQLSADQIKLSNDNDGPVSWASANDLLLRTAGGRTQTWPAGGLHFAADPSGVSLVDSSGKVLRTFILPAHAIGATP